MSVPNFRAICLYYGETDCLENLIGLLYGGQNHPLNEHRIVFDNVTLSTMLHKVGFETIRIWDWHTTEHSKYDDYSQSYLPHMDKENGRLMSLNMEAIK